MSGARLWLGARVRICAAMRFFPGILISFIALAAPVLAQPRPAKPVPARPAAAAPKAVGKFDDWTAATNLEAGQKVCYAFTRAAGSTPALPGRGEAVLLTVTQRQGGRDAVSLSAGFEYGASAAVAVQADAAGFEFYTAKRSAFARDGRATVAALLKAGKVVARSPGPRGGEIVDSFSLKGIQRAYEAIGRECPAR